MTGGITGILLAAGQSRRFPGNKLLHPVSHGLPLVLVAARRLREALPETLVIVKDAECDVAALLKADGFQIVINPLASEGIGTSIACGVSASRGSQGWLIGLADMPCIPPEIIRRLLDGLKQGAGIIAPYYRQQRGHPVGFSRRHGEALLQLSGDEGARHIIAGCSHELELLETEQQGVIADIDSVSDLLYQQHNI